MTFDRRGLITRILAFAFALSLLFVAGVSKAETFTGCLKNFGIITNVAIGTAPKRPCRRNSQQISWNSEGPPGSPPPPPPTALAVNCPFDSIQDAVDEAEAGTPLTITVNGTCTEEVVITTNDVTVQGNSIADEVVGGFTVTGAQRVSIKHLTIRDGTTSYPVGVFASRGAAVVLDDLFISGQSGAGIYVSRNAYADILGSTVQNPASGDNALLITDGGVVRASNGAGFNTFTSSNNAAVGLFRSASARFDGIIFIENSALGGGLAVWVVDTSNFQVRSSSGALIRMINGDVKIEDNSAADLREVDVGGNIVLERDSTLRVIGMSTVSGLVTIEDQSLLSLSDSRGLVVIDEDVTCTGGTAGGVINAAANSGGGSIIDCSLF